MKTKTEKQMTLPTFMAKACMYAQEHIDDIDAWPHDDAIREMYLTCVSFQMACFFSQNTVHGKEGVDSTILIDELITLPKKTEKQWLRIIEMMAKEFGGWK